MFRMECLFFNCLLFLSSLISFVPLKIKGAVLVQALAAVACFFHLFSWEEEVMTEGDPRAEADLISADLGVEILVEAEPVGIFK